MTTPVIDYTSKDFASIKASMLDYAARNFPEWAQASEGDFGVLLVELLAYAGDILSFYGDRIANETFLATATQRRSVLNLADLLAYTPNGNIASTGTVTFANSLAVAATVPAGSQVATDFVTELDNPIVFETTADLTVPAGSSTTATVIQGQTISREVIGASDGTVSQTFRLAQYPVIDGTVLIEVGDNVNGWSTWTYLQHLIDAGPFDTIYTTWTDEGGVVWVVFGDNTDGVIPPSGASIRATYRVGGGTVGNVAAGMVTTVISSVDGISIALNAQGVPISSVMTNGADAESIDQIRTNAPRSFRTQNRMVSLKDFGDAALGVASVAKANAVANSFTNVSVYIAGPSGVTSSALTSTVYSYLNDPSRKMAGATVTVNAAALIPVNVTLSTLGVLPQYDRTQVKNAVVQAIQNTLDFSNQTFAARVPVAKLYNAIALVPGVDYAALSTLARNDAAQGVVADVIARDWEIPVTGTVTITSTVGGF